MCGIAGFWAHAALSEVQARTDALAMLEQIRHRGPDAQGVLVDTKQGLTLAHQRLSIVDLSEQGAQPMQSHSGRYCIVYNGEIYNAQSIREELDAEEQCQWRGHSDTEVLLQAIEAWGLAQALQKARGMFAFALWDHHEQHLFLVRDRVGIKPLYYTQTPFGVLFASELNALLAHSGLRAQLDRDSLAGFLRSQWFPDSAR